MGGRGVEDLVGEDFFLERETDLRRHQRENVPVHSFTCHIISVPLYFFDEAEMSTGNKSPCTVHSEGQ